jgi:hypothetical protein
MLTTRGFVWALEMSVRHKDTGSEISKPFYNLCYLLQMYGFGIWFYSWLGSYFGRIIFIYARNIKIFNKVTSVYDFDVTFSSFPIPFNHNFSIPKALTLHIRSLQLYVGLTFCLC